MSLSSKNINLTLLACICFASGVYFKGSMLFFNQFVYYKFCLYYGVPFWPNRTNLNAVETKYNYQNGDDIDHLRKEAQAASARYMMYLSLMIGIPGGLLSIPLGVLSDKIGRKSIFFLSIGALITQILLAIATVEFELPLWTLLISSFVSGLAGNGTLTLLMLSFICIADLTSLQEDQSKNKLTQDTSHNTLSTSSLEEISIKMVKRRFLLICSLDVGIRFTSAVSTYIIASKLIMDYGFRPAVYFLLADTILIAISIAFLSETNQFQLRTENINQDEEELTNFRQLFYSKIRKNLRDIIEKFDPQICLGIGVLFLMVLIECDDGVDGLYLQNSPILWHSKELGIFFGLIDLGSSVVAALIGLIINFRGVGNPFMIISEKVRKLFIFQTVDISENSEEEIILPDSEMPTTRERIWKILVTQNSYLVALFLLLALFSRISMALASVVRDYYWRMSFLAIRLILGAPLFMCMPILRTLLSLISGKSIQGQVFASISMAQSISKLIGESLFPRIYEASININFIGLIYIIVATISFIAVICAIFQSKQLSKKIFH